MIKNKIHKCIIFRTISQFSVYIFLNKAISHIYVFQPFLMNHLITFSRHFFQHPVTWKTLSDGKLQGHMILKKSVEGSISSSSSQRNELGGILGKASLGT